MPWVKTAADRKQDALVYGNPEYRRNAATCKRQANGQCAGCRHRHGRLATDHITPVSQGGTHSLANLQAMCYGPGSCRCHEKKTANEGGGYRAARTTSDPAPSPRTQW